MERDWFPPGQASTQQPAGQSGQELRLGGHALGKLSGEEGALCKALGVHCSQARAPRCGATETLPPPQMQNWGYGAQFGSRETWQHGERRQKGEQQAGPPGPLKSGEEV